MVGVVGFSLEERHGRVGIHLRLNEEIWIWKGGGNTRYEYLETHNHAVFTLRVLDPRGQKPYC